MSLASAPVLLSMLLSALLPQAPPVDVAVDFAADVAPILRARCIECHGRDAAEGDLRLDSRTALFGGDRELWTVVPGAPDDSELLRRVLLPRDDEEGMPKDRPRLEPVAVDKLRRWIAAGAEWPGDLVLVPTLRRAWLPALAVAAQAARRIAIERLNVHGAVARALGDGDFAVGVDFARASFDAALLVGLEPCLCWLDLGGAAVDDAALPALVAFPELRRLSLRGTAVTDRGLGALTALPQLQELNVVDTAVTDRGLAALAAAPQLQRVHVWGTAVTPEGAMELERLRPGVAVDRGEAAARVDAATPDAGSLPDFAACLGVELVEVVAADDELDAVARGRIAAAVGLPPILLETMRVARAGLLVDGARSDVRLLQMRLGPPLSGGLLTLAVTGHEVHAAALGGLPELDDDPALQWAMYLHTLREASEGQPPPTATPAEIETARAALDPVAAFLLEQRRTMQQLVVLERQLKVLGRSGRVLVEPQPAAAAAASLRALAANAEPLVALLGADGAARYGEHAATTAAALEQLAAVDPGAEGARERMPQLLRSAMCSACHKDCADAGDSGETIRESLGRRRAAVAVPFGALRMGVDLAAAPADKGGDRSQAIAAAYRAALLAAGSVP